MRDLAFYEQVDHPQVQYRGQLFHMPVFYYDVTTMIAAFLTPLGKIKALLPSPRMKPLRATPWHGVTVFTCFEYSDCDAGPYNEVAISFPFTVDKPAPVLTGLLRHISQGPMSYVYKLPVTTETARQFGIDFYNFPKFIANIDFSRDTEWIHCRLAEGGENIFNLSVKLLPVKESPRWRFDAISTRGDHFLRSEVTINVRQQAISRNPANVRLKLGNHKLAQEIKSWDLGRMVHMQYVPSCQTILSSVVESYHK